MVPSFLLVSQLGGVAARVVGDVDGLHGSVARQTTGLGWQVDCQAAGFQLTVIDPAIGVLF